MSGAAKPGWRQEIGGRIEIGAFTVDTAANELHRDGGVVRIRPLLMDVLLRLAVAPGEVVSREQLLTDVWQRRMVNDEVLSRAIGELRDVLGDDAKQPQYIETLPKVGYRLVAVVRPAAASPVADSVSAPGDTQPPTAPAATTGTAGNRNRYNRLALIVGAAIAFAILVNVFRPRPDTTEKLAVQVAAARSFAADADLEVAPRFSPDGTNVIYAQGSGRATKLVLRDVQGNVVTTIEKPGALLLSPLFGPWSRRILYWQRIDDACAIVERDLASGAEREIIGCANQPQPRFDLSWDGAYIVVSMRHRAQHPFGLARVRTADGNVEMLTTPAPGEGDDSLPRFSPDGTRVVFARGNASHVKLWTMDLARPAEARPLVNVEGLIYGVAWLGRDGPLVAAADWTGFRALHRIDIATGRAELVGGRGARFPDAGPGGDLVFEMATYRADLWLTAADDPAGAPQMIWPSSRYSNQPEFSPDGKQVVFVSNREGAEALHIGTVGGEARRLAASTEHRYMRAHWTPDGKSLHAVRSPVSARQSGPREAVRIDAASARIEVLPQLGNEVGDVRQLDDGSFLVAEVTGNAMRLVRIVEGKPSRLPLPLVSQFQARGDDLVFMQPDLPTLTRCRISTLQCAPLSATAGENDVYHWHLARDALWYRGRADGGPYKLMRLSLLDGTTTAFDFPPTGNGTSIAGSPDGRQLVISREAPVVVDLMLAPSVR